MAFERKEVAREVYKGRTIVVRFLGPDVIGEVNGIEMGPMFIDTAACFNVAKRDIDKEDADKAATEKTSKPRRTKASR